MVEGSVQQSIEHEPVCLETRIIPPALEDSLLCLEVLFRFRKAGSFGVKLTSNCGYGLHGLILLGLFYFFTPFSSNGISTSMATVNV